MLDIRIVLGPLLYIFILLTVTDFVTGLVVGRTWCLLVDAIVFGGGSLQPYFSKHFTCCR